MCRLPAGQGIAGAWGFSLVEILVTISLLSFIVLGLLMMFNQTQRAFRGSMNQVDVQESGRIVIDMLARELEQASPSKLEPVYLNGVPVYETTNFFSELAYNFPAPLQQGLPGGTYNRMNIVQHFFFLTRHNQEWIGTGYAVIQHGGAHVGSLYRFTWTNRPPFATYNLNGVFREELSKALIAAQNNLPINNLSRVADGIVHLRLRPVAINGQPMLPTGNSNMVYRLPNGFYNYVKNTYGAGRMVDNLMLDQVDSYFVNDAMPAMVELELGVLEPNVLARYKAMQMGPGITDDPAQRNYLSNRVANVHIFRQRIPIRNVDTSVYQ
jgi:hypothetical protein